MDGNTEQKIRERAYHIWIDAGCRHGLALEHWAKAERDVVSAVRKPAAGASATKAVASKAAKSPVTVVTTFVAAASDKIKAASPKAKRTKAASVTNKTTPIVAKTTSKRAKSIPAEARATLN